MMQGEKNIDDNNLSEKLYNIPFKIETFNDMPFRTLGNSGLKVPNIGLGTWKIGYPQKGDGSRINEKNAFEIFDKAIELGVTFWDTANRYNNASGNSERVIGRWLQNNPDQRRNVILSSKLGGCMDGHPIIVAYQEPILLTLCMQVWSGFMLATLIYCTSIYLIPLFLQKKV